MWNKLKKPKKISLEKIKNYFLSVGLKRLVKDYENLQKKGGHTVYPPDLFDLYRIHKFIILNRRISTLEFGSGWSTIVIAHALNINKNNFLKKILKKKLRFSNPFKHYVLENEKKFLNITKKRTKSYLKNINVNYFYSENVMSIYKNRICSEYKKLPQVNPDFVYLDGPDQFNIKNKKNNLTIAHKDMMPMNSDLIKIEYFLTPGTIILTDGRTANANFLRNSFQRHWKYKFFPEHDQSLFLLCDKPLGKYNLEQLKLYDFV